MDKKKSDVADESEVGDKPLRATSRESAIIYYKWPSRLLAQENGGVLRVGPTDARGSERQKGDMVVESAD